MAGDVCSCRAFATLGHDPGPILLDAAANQMVANIAQFRPQACLASSQIAQIIVVVMFVPCLSECS